MSGKSSYFTLNNRVEIPAVGLGVFQSSPANTVSAVETALRDGYRLIDTAASYDNEREVGEGLARSGVDRAEVFVTSKLWISDYGYDEALRGFDGSLRRLGLEYLDLYLLHQPVPTDFDATVAAYEALERVLAEGRVRAIGVSNQSQLHLRNLVERTEVVPAINQVEIHPYFAQSALHAFHAEHGILTQAWSPLGGITVYRPADPGNVQNALLDPVIVAIAEAHGKTSAQVVLRWHLQHGTAVVPKSVRPARIAENFDLFDFTLTQDEIAAIDALDTGVRGGPNPELINRQTYPKTIQN